MKNDKLKAGDAVWYEDYCVHFCTVKRNNKDHIVVEENTQSKYIAVTFYSPDKRTITLCISSQNDIFVGLKFIAMCL